MHIWMSLLSAAPSLVFGALVAGFAPDAAGAEKGVDSEHIFGFTEGSDVGAKGDIEAEVETDGGIGKRHGTYAVTSTALQLKFGLTDNLRVAPTVNLASQSISGVPSLDDRHQFAFEGLGVELKYRLLDRAQSPFGLTFVAKPAWGRVDAATGEGVREHGAEFAALIDRELVKDRIFAAFNVLYEPSWSRVNATGAWERESRLGLSAAVTYRIMPSVFLGGEARYLRAYEGAALNTFSGHALFVGPTLYLTLSERTNLTLAWNVQVAGRAVDDAGTLDLVNFERHQVHVRFGVDF